MQGLPAQTHAQALLQGTRTHCARQLGQHTGCCGVDFSAVASCIVASLACALVQVLRSRQVVLKLVQGLEWPS